MLRPVRVGNLGTRSLIRDCDDLSVCKTRIKFEIQSVLILSFVVCIIIIFTQRIK